MTQMNTDRGQGGRTEHFVFDLKDRVLVKDIQRTGVVESLMVDSLGPQYRVTFWESAERRSVWLYAEEIERL